MNALLGVIAAAGEVESFCRDHHWRFCFIGGIAVQRWGMPRFTQDVDLTLLTGFGDEAAFVDALLTKFVGRLGNTRQFALERRVVLARTSAGVQIDIALGALPFEEGAVDRATPWAVTAEIALTTCSAEDLVVYKVFAGRDRDWGDVETVLLRQHAHLDLFQVRRELAPLLELKDDQESLPKLERLVQTVYGRLGN